MARRTKKQKTIETEEKDDSKLFAFLATFLSIIGFIIALIAKRDNKYVMFYAKQSLVIFIIAIIAGVIGKILLFIPIIGWIINFALNVIMFILWLVSWIYAISGKEKDVAVVGSYARKIKL